MAASPLARQLAGRRYAEWPGAYALAQTPAASDEEQLGALGQLDEVGCRDDPLDLVTRSASVRWFMSADIRQAHR